MEMKIFPMAKSKKNKSLPPRVKRMKRPRRLESAKKWIPNYSGNNLLRGYCNYYGVDWRCAAHELKILGISIDPAYLEQRKRTEAEVVKRRKAKKEDHESLKNQHWHSFTDSFDAYLAEDFSALHEIEMRQQFDDDSASE
jgi:hypothetical protein